MNKDIEERLTVLRECLRDLETSVNELKSDVASLDYKVLAVGFEVGRIMGLLGYKK